MRTDKQIYSIFAANPRWLFELTRLSWPGPCAMKSVSLKAIEQTTDGVIFPEASDADLWVVEFQFQIDLNIYNRMAIEMALVQQQAPQRGVQGVILFLDSSLDPKTVPWCRFVHSFYLNDLIDKLSVNQPKHPLVAVFRPVLTENNEILEKEAPAYYNQIKHSELSEPMQSILLDVFVNWLEQRFSEKGKKEIEEMLIGALPDLRDTRSGQDLIQIGKVEGKIEGKIEGRIEGKIEGLLMQLNARFGSIAKETRERIERIESVEQIDRLLLQVLAIDSVDQLQW